MEDLTQFKTMLANFSLEELYKEKEKCEHELSNMMLTDGSCFLKLDIINTFIAIKEEKNNG